MLANRNPLAVDARLITRRKEKQPKAQTFGWRGRNHLWADTDSGRRQSRSLRQPSTRPVSWLKPTFAGTNPCTKGTRCSAGGYRRRVPFTPKGLLAIRSPSMRENRQGTLRNQRKHIRSALTASRVAGGGTAFSPCGRGPPGVHAVAEGKGMLGVPRGAAGRRLAARAGRRRRCVRRRSVRRGRWSAWFA